MKQSKYRNILRILQFFVIVLLLSRIWQHFFWSQHFVHHIYNEHFFRLVAGKYLHLFEIEDYRRAYLVNFTRGMGFIYVITLICTIFLFAFRRFSKYWSVFFAFVVMLMPISKVYVLKGQYNLILEYTIQAFGFLILVWSARLSMHSTKVELLAKLAIAFTFIGHGLYALNVYPIPVNFITMTELLLGTGDDFTRGFLIVMGLLDIVAAVLLFVPKTILRNTAIIYCAIWGIATAMARIMANYQTGAVWYSLDQWLPETTLRLIHGGLPIFLFYYSNLLDKTRKSVSV